MLNQEIGVNILATEVERTSENYENPHKSQNEVEKEIDTIVHNVKKLENKDYSEISSDEKKDKKSGGELEL